MANEKISQMPLISTFASGDLFPIVDISEASAADRNKSVTFGELFRNVLGGSASDPSIAFTGDQNTGIYSPGADQVAVATNGQGRLFVDASGNVGVGTSSVNALLEVNNSTAGGEVQRIEGNYSGSGSVILTNWRRAGGSVAAAFKYNDDSSPLCMSIGTTTSHEFRIRTADTDAITIDASQQVGIGTSSPAFSNGNGLEIQRDGTACLRLDDNTNSKAGEIFADSTGLNIDARGTSAVLNFDIGGSTKATLDNSGRLLVGTSSARSNFYNTTAAAGFLLEGTDAQRRAAVVGADFAGSLILGLQKSGAPGGNTIVVNGDGVGEISFQGNDGSEFVACAQIKAEIDNTPGANDMPGRLVFSTTSDGASSPTERLRIDSSGRCGIGTASPGSYSAQLAVSGGRLAVVYTASGIELDPQFGFVAGTVRAYDRITSSYKTLGLTGNAVAFGINDVEKARIDSSGRLLVGTSSSSNLYAIGGANFAPKVQIQGTDPIELGVQRTDGPPYVHIANGQSGLATRPPSVLHYCGWGEFSDGADEDYECW
jgi:hypothetical protein